MRILLAHNSLYFPSHGGGDKSNRLLMEALVARGHDLQVMARLENFSAIDHEKFVAELEARETPVVSIRDGVVRFARNGVNVFTVTGNPRLRHAFTARIHEFDPDVILCSTDDPGALLLEVALRAPRARVVYLVRATVAVPFGPDCAFPNSLKTEMLGRVDSIIGVSEYVAQYVRKFSGFPAIHVPISLLEKGDYSAMGRFENEFVLMVNPCAVKGISIFVGLAEAMPEQAFAAVPTWGTNTEDIELLERHANIRVFEPVDDIAVLLRRTRVVLVPSVWAEARSRMVVEAMVRGIPVMASDVGGLHEAKLGVEYLLPVNPISRYHARVDSNMVPVAEVPPQDIAPWQAALTRLLTDRGHYEDVSRRSREAASNYAEMLHAGWLESHLEDLIHKPKREKTAAILVEGSALERLSPAKRKLLALRMQRKTLANFTTGDYFPGVNQPGRQILFCFPWAGAGASAFRTWMESPPGEFNVCAVRLPGRESRMDEAAFTRMEPLIAALAEAIEPHLDRDFAFYGHSMGAGIAFELTRYLRKIGLRQPFKLFVASARAPQLRTTLLLETEPSDAELAPYLPRDADLARLTLPLLRTDAMLYRNYVYTPDPPLDLSIHSFYGLEDPSLEPEQVRAWGEQTTGSFEFTTIPGGHLFLPGVL